MTELLSIKDVSKILKVSQTTVRRMLARSESEGVGVGRLWRIAQSEIDKLSHIQPK